MPFCEWLVNLAVETNTVNCITWLSCFRVSLAFPLHRSKPALRRSWSSSTTAGGLEGRVRLHEGSHVLLTSSNEMGTVRYLGPTDFASGIWLGLELRSAKGKNDGAVGDKRYFTCRPNHGVLVRPSRVTYRGINGSKLVDENCWVKLLQY